MIIRIRYKIFSDLNYMAALKIIFRRIYIQAYKITFLATAGYQPFS